MAARCYPCATTIRAAPTISGSTGTGGPSPTWPTMTNRSGAPTPPSPICIEEDSMGDLKSPWDDQGKVPFPTPGMEGDGVTARGGDPNINTGGTSGLKDFWPDDKQLMP